MNKRNLTANQIHELGIEALMNKLGAAGMIRFLHQHKMGEGNYSVDRHQWLTVPDVETLASQIQGAGEEADKELQEIDEPIRTILKELQKIDEAMKIAPRDASQKTEEVHKELQQLDEVMKAILQRLNPMPEHR